MSPIPLGFEQVNHVIRHIGRKVFDRRIPLFQSVCPLSLSLSLSQSPSLSISLSVSLSVSVSLSLSLSVCLWGSGLLDAKLAHIIRVHM